jgi:hypothetical protein
MALTSQAAFDIVNQTQSITFYEGVTQIDQVSYASNTITFASQSGFNLSQSDFALYFKYLNTFFNALFVNFPGSFASSDWPLCSFNITETDVGVQKITYTQTSLGNSVYTINYLPSITSAGFAARSTIGITTQEFVMCMNMMTNLSTQISLN